MKSDIFGFNSIGRVKFLAYTNFANGVLAFAYYFTLGFEGAFSVRELYSQQPYFFTLFVVLSFIPLKFLAQRYKDAGVSGWWALVGLIPHVYFFLYMLLGCYKGETHSNKNDKRPDRSSVFLQLWAFLPIVILSCLVTWYYYEQT